MWLTDVSIAWLVWGLESTVNVHCDCVCYWRKILTVLNCVIISDIAAFVSAACQHYHPLWCYRLSYITMIIKCITKNKNFGNLFFFHIQFWYLRCCGCPWNRGRQHLAMHLKTCHNTEAGFLTGRLPCLSPNSDVTASETPPFPHLGCVPAVVPAKGGSSA